MKNSTLSDEAGGARAFTPRGIPTMQYVSNQISDDFSQRAEDRANLVRAALLSVARRLIVAIPPARRTKAETQCLYDLTRGRRVNSNETLATVLALQARADTPFLLSSEFQAIEIRLAAQKETLCAEEASDAEDAAQVLLDQAQKLAEREKSPLRWRQVWESARESMYRIRRLMDAAAARAGRIA